MRRLGIAAVVAVVGTLAASEANAQLIGPSFIGPVAPTFVPGNSHAQFHNDLAHREFQRRALHAAAHRQGLPPVEHARLHRMLNRQRAFDARLHDDFHFGASPPVRFLPPATRATQDPFAGTPKGGNYFYWLSREYAKGRVSKSEYNRQVYGIGK
jgi:hypothetical protein